MNRDLNKKYTIVFDYNHSNNNNNKSKLLEFLDGM